ncbi:uncharacterized protein LOC118192572 [Stegodyphus dumicola]|uniref:uncharacterized protein LOC118192572 n=1 Tax=Stegodyphus dumicola TaxID=202533 RepID=UPI0015AACF80|nr:uncharacterized protein LOC118192572 [Stegodyphus dumicola]
MCWQLELACFKFDIIYHPGNKNETADTLSRINAAIKPQIDLKALHDELCHPGITRIYHCIRSKNLPFSVEEIRTVNSCVCCSEVKSRFYKSEGHLIKATAPFERLTMDVKGPLPTASRNRFLLTIVDEFSRFPFAITCPDMSSIVIAHLQNIFSILGMPAYVHSDRGSSFMSRELKCFLTSLTK